MYKINHHKNRCRGTRAGKAGDFRMTVISRFVLFLQSKPLCEQKLHRLYRSDYTTQVWKLQLLIDGM